MRCFVAVWPTDPVRAVLRALPRPVVPGVRWSTEDQWHVTLDFLGDVPIGQLAEVTEVLGAVATGLGGPLTVSLGPRTEILGPRVLCVAASGLDQPARAVRLATAGLGDHAEREPFFGHLSVARGRWGIPRGLIGRALSASWVAEELCLVGSTLGPAGARYETVSRFFAGRAI